MKNLLIPFILVIILAQVFLSTTNFKSQSNDSKFYTELVERYHRESLNNILTPKWGINWYGANPDTYIKDQFPGQLLLGILGVKLGLPPMHSLHIIEMWFQFFSIVLLYYFFKKDRSYFIFFGLLLTSNAFSYNIRANHESGLLLFSLLALIGGMNINPLLILFSTFMLLFIKGPFVIFGFLLSFLGVIFSGKIKDNKVKLIIIYCLNSVITLLMIYYFEIIFNKITGQNFLEDFIAIQIKTRALDLKSHHSFLIQKILNLLYYFYHILTYSLPWSLIAIIVFTKKFIQKQEVKWDKSLSILIYATLIYCVSFSISNRISSRYIFPAYYFFSTFVTMFIFYNSDVVKKFTLQFELTKLLVPTIIGIWLLAFSLHFF